MSAYECWGEHYRRDPDDRPTPEELARDEWLDAVSEQDNNGRFDPDPPPSLPPEHVLILNDGPTFKAGVYRVVPLGRPARGYPVAAELHPVSATDRIEGRP